MEQIAIIKLSNGQVGYYDELSRIHLTLSKPEAVVYAGTNCAQLRRSVDSGRLRIVSGSLSKEEVPKRVKNVSTFTKGTIIKQSPAEAKKVRTKTKKSEHKDVVQENKIEEKK